MDSLKNFESEKPSNDDQIQNQIVANDFEKIFQSNWSITKKILEFTWEYTVILLSISLKDVFLILFCRTKGLAVTEAITALSFIYDILAMIPWAFTTLYMYNIAEAYTSGNKVLVGKLTNKMNFFLLILGIIVSLFLFCAAGPIFSVISNSNEAISHFSSMTRWVSIGETFYFLQFGFLRYLMAIDKARISTLCALVSVVIKVFFMYLYIHCFDLVDFGTGMSLSIGVFVSFASQLLYIVIKEPYPTGILDGIFEDFLVFVWDSLKVGITVYLCYFSFGMIPFFGLLISDEVFTYLNIIFIMIGYLTIFSEGVMVGTTILINYLIGKQVYSSIQRVFWISLCLIAVLDFILGGVSLLFFSGIIRFFTNDASAITFAGSQATGFFFAFLFTSCFNTIAFTLIALGGEFFTFVSTIIGKFIIAISLILFLVHLKNGFSSVINAFIISQVITEVMYITYMVLLFKDNNKYLNIRMLEITRKKEMENYLLCKEIEDQKIRDLEMIKTMKEPKETALKQNYQAFSQNSDLQIIKEKHE